MSRKVRIPTKPEILPVDLNIFDDVDKDDDDDDAL